MTPEKIKALIDDYAAARGIRQTAAIAEISAGTGIAQSSLYNWIAGNTKPYKANLRALENFVSRSK